MFPLKLTYSIYPCCIVLSIAGIVCEYYGVLCESGPWSFKTAHAYITVIDGVSITYVVLPRMSRTSADGLAASRYTACSSSTA